MAHVIKPDEPRSMAELEARPADEPVQQVVEVADRFDLDMLREIAEADGLEVDESLTPEFVAEAVIILGLIGTAGAVAGAVSYWMEKRRGGQVIDFTKNTDAERYRRVPGLQYGLVVVIAEDGEGVTVDVKEPRGYFSQIVKDVIDAVAGSVGKAAETVTEVVRRVVGDRGMVTPSVPDVARA